MSVNTDQQQPMMETLWNAAKGAALGAGVVTTVAPGLYCKNMLQTQQKIIWKNCMKGAPLLGMSVVPQAAVAVAANSLIEKYIFKRDRNTELTTGEKLIAASSAGAVSGIVSTPFEFIVQNYQNGWQNSMSKVARVAVEKEGYRVLIRGAFALATREAMYTSGYLVLTHQISEATKPYIKNELARTVVGAVGAGVIVGAATTPPCTLRANKQWINRGWSYPQTVRTLGLGGLACGTVPRILAVIAANGIMSQAA